MPAERIDTELSSKYAELRKQCNHWGRCRHAGLVLFFCGILSIYLGVTYVLATTDLTYALLFVISTMTGLPFKHDMTAVSKALQQLAASNASQVLIGSIAITAVCLALTGVVTLLAGKRPTSIEVLFTRFYDVTSLVQESFGTRPSRNERAFRTLRTIVEDVEDEWRIPDEISWFVDGRDIADFKQNLNTRLLGAVKEGNEKSLATLIRIDRALLNPGLESLPELNAWMQNSLPRSEIPESRGMAHLILSRYLTSNRVSIAALVSSGLVGSVFYYVCLSLLGVSKETSIMAAVSVFGILFGGYVAKTR